ncbi:MAG: SusC/RagA family TonB-linked outer membrane protein, partial [Prevotella sp.]|nr:SusC/RagA family TonB-linked outer membrane protein [Prevotella sp.]
NFCRKISPIYPVHTHDVNTGEYLLDKQGNWQYDSGSYTDQNGQVIVTRNQYMDRHVIWENQLNQDKTIRNTVNGIAYANVMLPYNFTFTLKGNLNLRNNEESIYESAVIGDGKGNNGRGRRRDLRTKSYAFQQQLHWNHEYGVHSIDALLAHENYDYTVNEFYVTKNIEIEPGLNSLINFAEPVTSQDYS